MGITARPRRVLGLGAVACLVLLGPAAGLLGTSVSAAAAASSGVPAAPGAGRFVPYLGSASFLAAAAASSGVLAAPDAGGFVPHPGSSSFLAGLSCPSPGNCWAVGGYASASGAELNQALHWNGARWSRVSVPSPGGTAAHHVSALSGVACTTSANCWAVGVYAISSGAGLNQALHWNGRTWSRVPTPNPNGTGAGASNTLNGVTCAAPANCWAVGSYGVVHNGTGVQVNQALHWNGRTWSRVATPNPALTASGDASELISVRCIRPASCWAVGDSQRKGGPDLNQALHWNGTRWSTG